MSIRSLLIVIMIAGLLFAQEKQISIAIDDLPRLLQETSLQNKLINERLSLIRAQKNAVLQWSNPELNFEQERVESNGIEETEQLFSFSKTFQMPWNYWQLSSIWQSGFDAAKLNKNQEMRALLSRARMAYIKVELLSKSQVRQNDIKMILKNLKKTLRSQSDEGAISGIDAKLLAMGLFSLESDILSTHKKKRLEIDNLKQLLGMDPEDNIDLSTSIVFKGVQTNLADNQKFVENHSGLKATKKRLVAAEQKITMEQSQIIPTVTVEAGYKKVDPGWEGYTFGLSVPIPVLNWNGAKIEEQKINQRIRETENTIYKQKLQSRLDNLVEVIKDQIQLLQGNEKEQLNPVILEDMLVAYQEGAMSFTEFLNAIQIYRDGTTGYTEQLVEYYKAVFELEAIAGQQFVTF